MFVLFYFSQVSQSSRGSYPEGDFQVAQVAQDEVHQWANMVSALVFYLWPITWNED